MLLCASTDLALLAWSEGYAVEITAYAIRLRLVDYTEDLGDEGDPSVHTRTLQDLLRSGELVRVLK